MALQGIFSLYLSERFRGHLRLWQFVVKNTNMFMSETFDIMLMDRFGQQPFIFRNIKLKPGQSVAFNTDTVDWSWCQDDYAAIIDANNNIKKKWLFHIREYAIGECPECHGTHKCRRCRGQGFVYPNGRIEEGETCPVCAGTGICHTCDIPRRTAPIGMGPTGLKPF